MDADNPLVSVIVPSYNHQNYIEECLYSILNQTYKNIQLIVIDDGSSDNTAAIINKLKETHEFIFEQQENIGLSKTLNKAITKYAQGKYISIVASDDFWCTNKISLQVEALEKNNNLAMLCGKAKIVNSKSEIISNFNESLFLGKYTFAEIALGKCLVVAATAIIKKEVFDKVGLFDENLLIEDLDMWLRVAVKFEIGFLNEYVAFYRSHDVNTSLKVVEMNKARFVILNKWTNIDKGLFKKVKRNMELIAINELGKKYPKEAAKYFNPSFINFLNSKYRKYILSKMFKGRF